MSELRAEDLFRAIKNGQTKIVCSMGRKQAGKTTTISQAIQETEAKEPWLRFLILDNGRAGAQFSAWGSGEKKVLPPGKCVVYQSDKELYWLPSTLPLAPYHICRGSVTLEGMLEAGIKAGGVNFVCDEIDQHISKTKIPQSLNEICQRGAHKEGYYGKGVSLIWLARRMQNIHNILLSQCDYFFLVKTTHNGDLQRLSETCGFEKDDLQELKKLEIGDVVRYDENELSLVENIYYIKGLSQPYNAPKQEQSNVSRNDT